jgi:hypothetical protein
MRGESASPRATTFIRFNLFVDCSRSIGDPLGRAIELIDLVHIGRRIAGVRESTGRDYNLGARAKAGTRAGARDSDLAKAALSRAVAVLKL